MARLKQPGNHSVIDLVSERRMGCAVWDLGEVERGCNAAGKG